MNSIAAAMDVQQPEQQSEAEASISWQHIYQLFKGEPAQNSIYLGMWSHHIIDNDDEYQTTHNLLGITYRGFFGGTFINSVDEQAWGAGVQRDLYSTKYEVISMELGYRLGVLYGYDSMQMANSGLFPLLQMYADLHYEHIGIQLSWAGSAITAGFFLRF
ncbi:MAG: hypothetical protein ACR2PB_07735 [Desulfocapsaceae bacterium]